MYFHHEDDWDFGMSSSQVGLDGPKFQPIFSRPIDGVGDSVPIPKPCAVSNRAVVWHPYL